MLILDLFFVLKKKANKKENNAKKVAEVAWGHPNIPIIGESAGFTASWVASGLDKYLYECSNWYEYQGNAYLEIPAEKAKYSSQTLNNISINKR